MTTSNAPRFLITRLSHIGDCIETLPLLCALRRHYPQAFIAWAMEGPSDQLIGDHPALDQVVKIPRGWMKSAKTIAHLRRQLRELQVDTTLDPQSLTKSSLLARLSGAKRRVGLGGPFGREVSKWLNNQRVRPTDHHIVPRSLALLGPLGIQNPSIEYQLRPAADAQAEMTSYVQSAHLGSGFAVLNPGTTTLSRMWEMDRFGLVAKHLGRKYGVTSVVTWAGQHEEKLAQEIVEHSGGHALMAPPTSLQQLAALLKQADCFVGSDTGPMHLAEAVGTACVVLFGTTRAELSGPYGPQHICLQAHYQRLSKRLRKQRHNDAMRAISAEQVCDACDRLFAERAQKPQSAA